MIPRVLDFLKTPQGKTVTFVAMVMALLVVIRWVKHPPPSTSEAKSTKLPTVVSSHEGIRPEQAIEQEAVSETLKSFSAFPLIPVASVKPSGKTEEFVPTEKLIFSYQEELPASAKPAPARTPGVELPPGMLIQCRLFNGIESNLPETPLIAHTIREVRVNGKVVIPIDSEVHGTVRADDQRMRVMTGTSWQIVTPTGKVILVNGMGLNREYDAVKDIYGYSDGFAGVEGVEVKQDSEAIKGLLAASSLSAIGKLGQERSRSIYGEEIVGSVQNGAIAGATAVTDRLAEMKMREVEKKRPFIRVPAATEFYVYTQAAVEVADAPAPTSVVADELKRREMILNSLQAK